MLIYIIIYIFEIKKFYRSYILIYYIVIFSSYLYRFMFAACIRTQHAEYGYWQPSVECFHLRHSFCVDQQKKTRYENSIQSTLVQQLLKGSRVFYIDLLY